MNLSVVTFDAGKILASSSRGRPPFSGSDVIGTPHGNFAFVLGEGILLPEYARSLTLLGADLPVFPDGLPGLPLR